MPGVDMTAHEFRELFDAVSNWGRWDDDGRARGSEPSHPRPHRRRRRARSERSHDHAQPTSENPGGHRRAGARRPPHDDADRRRHRLGVRALRQGLRRRRLPQRRAQPHRRLLPRGLRGFLFDGKPESSVTADGRRRRVLSRSSRTDWSAAASCSTCRACAAFPGSSRASTCSAKTSRRRSATRG